MICSPVCRINRVCETKNMFEVQTLQDVQQGKWLLHFAAFNKTLLQQAKTATTASQWPANNS